MAKNNFYTIMNICIFVGARPNFIKVAPILRAMDAAGVDHSLVYAGREDDPTLEASLFDDLQMSRPDVYLGVDCENLNEFTGQVMSTFERYLQEHKTDTVNAEEKKKKTNKKGPLAVCPLSHIDGQKIIRYNGKERGSNDGKQTEKRYTATAL